MFGPALQTSLHDLRTHGSAPTLRREEGWPPRAVQPREDLDGPAQGMRKTADLGEPDGSRRSRSRARALRARRERGAVVVGWGEADGSVTWARSGCVHPLRKRLSVIRR